MIDIGATQAANAYMSSQKLRPTASVLDISDVLLSYATLLMYEMPMSGTEINFFKSKLIK